MPGTRKMFSITIVPASRRPNSYPETVTTGEKSVLEGVPEDY